MNIMKEAHKLTREIKNEYPEVDYKFQLGLCISYLYKIKGEVVVEDKRITAIKELAETPGMYNTIWNKVENLSKEIRGRKFNSDEINGFSYKAENLIALAEEILKEETKKDIIKNEVSVKTKKEGVVYAQYEGFDAESQERIYVGDAIVYIKGLGWIKADNY